MRDVGRRLSYDEPRQRGRCGLPVGGLEVVQGLLGGGDLLVVVVLSAPAAHGEDREDGRGRRRHVRDPPALPARHLGAGPGLRPGRARPAAAARHVLHPRCPRPPPRMARPARCPHRLALADRRPARLGPPVRRRRGRGLLRPGGLNAPAALWSAYESALCWP
ncbi:hypothetical protein SBD_6042 [Streptomyces bottropensis ATCC 25435]|uniref:Uncharacterized protein n=1 Tax=Streptomyces bottropensis ATCC 25435 TaxID=1054862 RepID=M3E9W5_9ACTN|nr:hypothetical protein SBD_6042 [Streptomyces bottropensis ATCC 25435]